jgi:hypothetical protein
MAKRVSKERRLAREWVERRTALLQKMEERAQRRDSRRGDDSIGEIDADARNGGDLPRKATAMACPAAPMLSIRKPPFEPENAPARRVIAYENRPS